MKVLVVDDNISLRDHISKKLIQINDFSVAEVSDKNQLSVIIPVMRPDVIIMDTKYTFSFGEELLEDLRTKDIITNILYHTDGDNPKWVNKAGDENYNKRLNKRNLDQILRVIRDEN